MKIVAIVLIWLTFMFAALYSLSDHKKSVNKPPCKYSTFIMAYHLIHNHDGKESFTEEFDECLDYWETSFDEIQKP